MKKKKNRPVYIIISMLVFIFISACLGIIFLMFHQQLKEEKGWISYAAPGTPDYVKLLAKEELNGEIEITKDSFDWLEGIAFYEAENLRGDRLVYRRIDLKYIKINTQDAQNILFINNILKNYPFSIDDFQDYNETFMTLTYIQYLYSDVGGIIAVKYFLDFLVEDETVMSYWLQGTEKNPEVLIEMFYEPIVIVDGDEWKAKFNFITQKGAAEQWNISGIYDTKLQAIQIKAIEIKTIKKNGTFSWAMYE